MTSIAGGSDQWRPEPLGGPWGTGVRLAPADDRDAPAQPQLVDTRHGAGGSQLRDLLAGTALAGGGIGAIAGGGAIGARMGSAGIGRGLGIALGVAAIAGAAFLIHRGATGGSTEYLVHFRDQPDLDGVAPGDVYETLRAHHERHAPAVQRELATLLAEEKVRSYSGIIGSNGFVVDVVNKHRDEVEQRLQAIDVVGDVAAAPLS